MAGFWRKNNVAKPSEATGTQGKPRVCDRIMQTGAKTISWLYQAHQTPIIIGVTRTAMRACAVTYTAVVSGTDTVGSISTSARSTKTPNDSKFMILRQTRP